MPETPESIQRDALIDWYMEDEGRISDLIDHAKACEDQIKAIRNIANITGRGWAA